jgi:tetratricopeptide (TPR) repeat protein
VNGSLHRFLRPALILLLLVLIILTPRLLAGVLQRKNAMRFEVAGEYDRSAQAYKLAAERLPWQPELWEKAGMAYLKAGDHYEALLAFVRAEEKYALSTDGRMYWGDAARGLGDPLSAIELWKWALRDGGNPRELWSRLAFAYHASSNFAEESSAWQEYLRLQPQDAPAQYRLGLLLVSTSPQEALPHLIEAARLDSSFDPAVQSLRSALNTAFLSADEAYQFVVAGQALGGLSEWDLALVAFNNAVRLQPDYADGWAWLSEARQQIGLDGSAEIEKAVDLDPDRAMIQSLYGLYLQRQEQTVKALAAFQRAAALEPSDPGWQMALGRAYELTNDLVAALGHYQQAVALAPQDAPVWQALASFSLRNGVDLVGVGLPAARRLVELQDDDWQSLDIAGQIILETGDPVGAEVLLMKAIELDPMQAAPALHLGLVYLQMNNRQAAYLYLIQANGLDPAGADGWQAKRLLEQYFP